MEESTSNQLTESVTELAEYWATMADMDDRNEYLCHYIDVVSPKNKDEITTITVKLEVDRPTFNKKKEDDDFKRRLVRLCSK